MGPFPHDAPAAQIDANNPMGTDGFEFVEFCHPDPAALDHAVPDAWASRRRQAPRPECRRSTGRATSTTSSTPSRAPSPRGFAEEHGPWRRRWRSAWSTREHAYERALALGRQAGRHAPPGRSSSTFPPSRASAALHIYFVDRYGAKGSIYDVDFDWIGERDPKPDGRRPLLHRPPDAQRPSRAHGRVGRLLRAPLQLPPDPLLRHRGQADGPALAGDDQPRRQDPHPDQRGRRRTRARSRNICSAYKGEGIQHIACGCRTTSTRTVESAARGAASSFMPAPPTSTTSASIERVPGHGEPRAGWSATAS